MPDRPACAIGVDLGGTKIAAGLFDASGALLGALHRAPTLATGPREVTLASLHGVIARALGDLPPGMRALGVGIGSSGPLDPVSGTILGATNLQNLSGFPLLEEVTRRFGLDAAITNDGNAFALAEAQFGAGAGESIVVGVTLGTGCGCGIVLGGQLLEGATANAGEVYLACAGPRGNFDEVLSGKGLSRELELATGERVSGEEIHRRASQGDAAALAAYTSFGRAVGGGLATIVAVLDPRALVLGGSAARGLEWFLPALREELFRRVAPAIGQSLKILPSALGDCAGALGGAALLLRSPSRIR